MNTYSPLPHFPSPHFNGIPCNLPGLEEDILITVLVQHIRVVAYIDALQQQRGFTSLLLLPQDSLLVLDLLQAVELLSLQFVQLGDDVRQGALDAGNDDCKVIKFE